MDEARAAKRARRLADLIVMRIPVPPDELERLRLLAELGLIDTSPDPAFDEIAWLAAAACGTPISLVCFVDAARQLFRARLGVSVSGTSRCISFCAHAICGRKMFVVPDTLADPRFADNPLVTGDPQIRFYAGMPVTSPCGVALGTVCVADREPRELNWVQATMLESLATWAADHLTGRGRRVGVASPASTLRPLGWAA